MHMKAHKTTKLAPIILACLLILAGNPVHGQSSMPEILDTGTMKEQLDYIQGRTRIYNDFRAIREDMFRKIKSNALDTLSAVKNENLQLEDQIRESNTRIETLQADLQNMNDRLDQAIKNRDRLTFLGIPMQKSLYHSVMWMFVSGLALLAVILFLANKRNLSTAIRNRKNLEETNEEFEAHRKQARERQEKLAVQHHNELRRLKGN